MDMIALHHIHKQYGSRPVLRDVTLTVHQGEIYGLVGKNGAGKTTLFKIILGLTDWDAGTLALAGCRSRARLPAQRRKIGFFIGKNFFPRLTARENLDYYRRIKGIRDPREVDRVLALVGLGDTDARYATFSLGMQQRLGIANALLGNPHLLILDEPVNGLDPQGIADIRRLLRQLNRESGMTILVSSHILGELEHTATRFGILDQGQVLQELTQADLQVPDGTVRLRVQDAEAARQLLREHHIPFREEAPARRSLESYYFALVGGADHV